MFDDLIENPTPRCPCLLVLDTSASMDGAPIHELNAGVAQFLREVQADEIAACAVELGIITFGGRVETALALQGVGELTPPVFPARGDTPMGDAVTRALDALEQRKQEYRHNGVSYYQPWLVLMSDGAPTDDWAQAAARCRALAGSRKLNAFAVGIGPHADLDTLSAFTPENRPALRLDGLRFADFFAWLSRSMAAVSQSTSGAKTSLPSIRGWAEVEV